jgi:hypothetical protein
VSPDCWSTGLPKAPLESLKPTLRAGAAGRPGACPFFLSELNMAPPQLISDFMRLMLLLAPSAAIICLVLAGLSLRQGSIPDALIGGNFAKWMLVPFVWRARSTAGWRRRNRVDGEPSD